MQNHQNKEKLESELHSKYEQAIERLEQGDIKQGIDMLKSLLEHQLIPSDKTHQFAIYRSLAEVQAQSSQIQDKCQSLYYFHQSNLLQEQWQTYRRMGILLRQLGLIPQALKVMTRAYSQCSQESFYCALSYQICCLCFLMKDKNQFKKYYTEMKEGQLKSQLENLYNYFLKNIESNNENNQLIDNLLIEQEQIPEKLKLVPSMETEFFNQQQEYNLKIDSYDLSKFFKKIKNFFQINIGIEKKLELSQDDKSTITNIQIFVTNKLGGQKKKQKDTIQSQQPVKQSERMKSKKTKQQQDQQFILDQQLQNNFSKLIDYIKGLKEYDGIDIFDQINIKSQIEQISQQECPLALFLIKNLEGKRFSSIFELLYQLIYLILEKYEQKQETQEQFKDVKKRLINCLVWAQFSTNKFTDNINTKLKLLESTYIEFTERCHNKKYKLQQQKLQNFIKLIIKLKLDLMLQIRELNILEQQQQIEFIEQYYELMAEIHSDVNFFQSRIAKQFANRLNDEKKREVILEKIKLAKVQLTTNSPYQQQQINQIADQWEVKEQKDNDKLRSQINYVEDYLQKNKEQAKRFSIICFNQFYFAQQKEQLQKINKLFQNVIKQCLDQSNDISSAFIALRYAMVFSMIEQDSSEMISSFLKTFLNIINRNQYPQKILIIIETLKIPYLNFNNLFNKIDINLILQEINQQLITMRNRYNTLYDFCSNNFVNDLELKYYILSLYTDKTKNIFKIESKQLQVEIEKNETKYQPPDDLSENSDNEFTTQDTFQNNFQQILLTTEQIKNPFRIFKKIHQFSLKSQEFFENHNIQVNLGDPYIIDHLKRLVKEQVKFEFGISTKDLCSQLFEILFENYYLNDTFENQQIIHFTNIELEFFALIFRKVTTSFISKKLSVFLNKQVKPFLYKSIEPEIEEYANFYLNYIVQPQNAKFELKSILNKICEWKAHLFLLLFVIDCHVTFMKENQNEKEIEEISDSQKLMNICYAISYNCEQPYLLENLYQQVFEWARSYMQLKNSSSQVDWFLAQKKVYALTKSYPQLKYLIEYKFIMDLLKVHQRQMEYQMNSCNYQKVVSALKILFKESKNFILPDDPLDLSCNFRAQLLCQKRVIRKLRDINLQEIIENIDTLLKMKNLIEKMNKYELTYFLSSKQAENEIELDIYITIFKFIKRFIRCKLYYSLNGFLSLLQERLPSLFIVNQEQQEFNFDEETKLQKIQHLTQDELIKEREGDWVPSQVTCVLNNLSIYFLSITQQEQVKKKKLLRYQAEGIYYAGYMKFYSNIPIENAFSIIQLIFMPNNRELINYYLQYDKFLIEKDEILKNYYNHDLIFTYLKSKLIKLIIKILLKQRKFKDIYQLFDKLNKIYDLRLLQACLGLYENCHLIEDKILLRDIIMKIEYYKRNNDLFKQEFPEINQMYITIYQLESQNIQEENREIQIEKGKKIIEDFRATKRKPHKPKEQTQTNQIDDINRFFQQEPLKQDDDEQML